MNTELVQDRIDLNRAKTLLSDVDKIIDSFKAEYTRNLDNHHRDAEAEIARLKRRETSAFITVRQNLKDALATTTAQQARIRELLAKIASLTDLNTQQAETIERLEDPDETMAKIASLTDRNGRQVRTLTDAMIASQDREVHRQRKVIAEEMAKVEALETDVHRLEAELAEKAAWIKEIEARSARQTLQITAYRDGIDTEVARLTEKSLSDAAIVQERETVVTGRTIERLEGLVTYKDGQIARMTAETLAQEERIERQRQSIRAQRKLIKAKDKIIKRMYRKLDAEEK